MDWLQAATLLFGGGTVGILIKALFGRSKDKADVADRLTRSARDWIQDLEDRQDRLEAENRVIRAELRELRERSETREFAFMRYIRVLRDALLRVDPEHPIPNPPPEIRDTVGAK